MNFRLELMASNNLGISDIQNAVNKLDLLDGAKDFLDEIKESFQVVILSDTFHEFASPLMKKMGYPLLLCHNLDIDQDGSIKGYKLRHAKAKQQAIEAFQSIGYQCLAAGDSYNDIQMFDVADHAFFMNAPEKIAMEFPKIPSFNKYDDLKKAFLEVV